MNLTKKERKKVEFILVYITLNLKLMKYHPSILTLCSCFYVTGRQEYENCDDVEIISCMRAMKKWINRGTKKNLKDLEGVLDFYNNNEWIKLPK